MIGRRLCLIALGLLCSGSLLAAEHVLFSDSAALPADLSLPGQVGWQQAITIPAPTVAELATGDGLVLEGEAFARLDYQLVKRSTLINGDTGWQGQITAGDTIGGLSLTVGGQQLLASFFTSNAKYSVLAKLSEDGQHYVGWVYSLSRDRERVPADNGGVFKSASKATDQSALSGNDVSIKQTFSNKFATIGDRVDVSVEITNNLSSALSNESVNILYVADNTEFLSSSSGCTLGAVGQQSSIQCTVSTLAPDTSTTLHYAIRLTEESYYYVASRVYVGDVRGSNVRNDAFLFATKDTLIDSDNDGFSDFNEALLGTNPTDAESALPADTIATIDLLFLYTHDFLNDIGSVSPETRINQLIETTNSYYLNSGAGIRFQPVHYGLTSYSVSSLHNALNDLSNYEGPFNGLPTLRDSKGADIVVVIDGLLGDDTVCGTARAPGSKLNGELFHPYSSTQELYSVLYLDGYPAGGGSGCEDDALAHELGHNLGLMHSHRDTVYSGTYTWSHGHGIDGRFSTIMAYSSRFPGAQAVPLFSNPDSTDCSGLPCGVDRNDTEQGADAVHSLNQTRFQVAAKRSSRLLDVATLNGSSSGLLMLGAATRNGDTSTAVNTFSAQDTIDVRATLRIPREHRDQIGTTYTVIAVDGAGLFYRDAAGGYIAWDGTFETLGGAISPRALAAEEELIAFSDFVPASIGVNAASLTVFFAYGVGSDIFVYSASGIPFTIQ